MNLKSKLVVKFSGVENDKQINQLFQQVSLQAEKLIHPYVNCEDACGFNMWSYIPESIIAYGLVK